MIKNKKICCCGCNKEGIIWAKGLLKECFLRLNPPKTIKSKKKSIKKINEKSLIKKESKKKYTEKQFELFKEIYKEHPTKKCFECGKPVNGESSAQFHHLLFKSIEKYKKFALEKWNICLLCENCHSQVHLDSSKTPKVQKLTNELKEIYG